MKAKGERHYRKGGEIVYPRPRIVRLPSGVLQPARIPTAGDGRLIDEEISFGIVVNGNGDGTDLFKQMHDEVDRILEQPIVEVE